MECYELCLSLQVTNGMFTLDLKVDTVITLSTLQGQQKGDYPNVPASMPFPVKYMDDFNSKSLHIEH